MLQDLIPTRHAEARMRQRGLRDEDIRLAFKASTQVTNDAFVLTDRDAAREIQKRKREIQTFERLKGCKLIVEGGALVTCYHIPAAQARLRRNRKRRQGVSL